MSWWPRRDIAYNIAELKMRAQQIGERRTRFSQKERTNPELVGVDYIKELTKWVTNEEYKDGVLSVLGFGGVGKTAIATALYRQLGDQFDLRAMVTVSQSSDVEAILRSILEQVMPQANDGQEQQQGGRASQKKRLHHAIISYHGHHTYSIPDSLDIPNFFVSRIYA
ncbi:hypothetical protein OsI_31121 [Oryza sativa Indica Group]|uniref:NB-ARC domain-containing protein n=1 Tax=Oryza sativa subsp. indica TaxID=39946 RepID=B8BEX8_ORYSI|nr:hypothetical protein OsI_31121 [Oryza sativa Indica Group]